MKVASCNARPVSSMLTPASSKVPSQFPDEAMPEPAHCVRKEKMSEVMNSLPSQRGET